MVLSDSFFSGWAASVNDEEANIFRANFLFRAVRVPGGKSVVDCRYGPRSFDVGKLTSLLGLALLFGVWGLSGLSNRKCRGAELYSSSSSATSSASKSASSGCSSTL